MESKQSSCYSFPLFVPDNELLVRKIPVINFLYNDKLVNEPDEINMSGKELVREAFIALRQKNAQWQKAGIDAAVPDYIFVTAPANNSIAEKILDPSFMAEAFDTLQCSTLEVAIPHNNILIACNAEASDNTMFNAKVNEESARIEFAILSGVNFLYQDGRIIDIKAFKSSLPDILPTVPAENQHLLLNVTKVPVFTGDFFCKVNIGAPNQIQLMDLCERVFMNLLQQNVVSNTFLGIIEFVINSNSNPYTPSLEEHLHNCFSLLISTPQVKEISRQMKKNIEVSVLFSEHLASGETFRKKHFKVIYNR